MQTTALVGGTAYPLSSPPRWPHSLWGVPLFREHSQDELPLLVWLIRGGNDDVLAGAQAETLRHLAQVDVGLTAGLGWVEQEEVLLHVLLVSMHLGWWVVGGGGWGEDRKTAQMNENRFCHLNTKLDTNVWKCMKGVINLQTADPVWEICIFLTSFGTCREAAAFGSLKEKILN